MRRYSPLAFALLGLSLTACWGNRSKKPPIHLNPNMDWQQKFEAQEVNTMFEDGRAMRPPPEGTVAQGFDKSNTELWDGRDFDGRLVETLPPSIELNEELLARGEDRYNIYCSPCHDQTGSGEGIVTKRGGGFAVAPANLHANKFKAMPVGHFYDVITNGKGTMLPYAAQIVHPEDRWAIVAWVKALQLHGRDQGWKAVEDKAAITELANLAAPKEVEPPTPPTPTEPTKPAAGEGEGEPQPPDAGVTDGPAAAGGDVEGVERKGKRIKLTDGRIEFDGDALTADSQALVDKVAAYMKGNPDILVLRVDGHTNNDGDVDKLRRKSRRWAQAVIDRMVEQGVDEGRLKNKANGDTKPLSGRDPSDKKNNRVEFRITKLEEKESDNG